MQSLAGQPQRDAPEHVPVPMTSCDKWVRALRTGLHLLPLGIGSAIDSGYFGTIDDRRVARLEKFFRRLAKDVSELHAGEARAHDPNVMLATFQSDEFAYIWESVLRRVNAEVVQEKLDALRGVLVSVIAGDVAVPFEKQVSFLKTVDVIEGTHVRILLHLAAFTRQAISERYRSRDSICTTLGAIAEGDVNYVYSALDTLANREFIMSGPIPFDKDGTLARPRQTFCAMALGVEFLEYIRAQPEASR